MIVDVGCIYRLTWNIRIKNKNINVRQRPYLESLSSFIVCKRGFGEVIVLHFQSYS